MDDLGLKKTAKFFSLALLALATLACTITFNLPFDQAGPTRTLNIAEALPSGSPPYQVILNLGAGELELAGGAKGLVEGTVRYNLEDWKPQVIQSGSGVTISQEFKNLFVERPINEWKLQLGSAPIDLQVKAGAYSTKMQLGGIRLTGLDISEGASQTEINFSEPNPEGMLIFRYNTGGSQSELKGLSNANFKEMRFEGAAGNYTLDFSTGKPENNRLRQEAKVTIKTGVCNLRLVIPKGIPSRVQLNAGLNNITTEGTWTVNGTVYQTIGEGPGLDIRIETGLGNLILVSK